jgi:hypothetical protein
MRSRRSSGKREEPEGLAAELGASHSTIEHAAKNKKTQKRVICGFLSMHTVGLEPATSRV